ncbi:hypothetical protein [Terricaulis sp.]|uniref:hypothetical protein n=1 Tax=Terricaulis sp. TaxID=2768686 RepID=UPI002AC701C2|nr:hypothetical protein [Terricaulis sp.]MDZ4693047.1 hypothetical protein [Terricaulis sp.]
MAIIITENDTLKLHVIRFRDRVTFNELCALGACHREYPAWAAADAVHIVEEGSDLSDLSEAKLEVLRQHYRALHQSLELFLVRRAVWVCRDVVSCSIVEYWLKDRHSRDGQGTDLMLVANLKDASELLTAEEISAVEHDHGFVELVRFEDRASEGRAA